MKLCFIWPGKTKDEHLDALVAEYLKRLRRFVRCEIIETREVAGTNRAAIEKTSDRLVAAIPTNSRAVLLDVNGREWSSEDLAEQVKVWENDSVKEIAIVIGGAGGVSENVSRRANKRWQLSRLTFTHEMARVLVVEQFYRAYTINRGMPYQK